MRCYVTHKPCTCDLDDVCANGCYHDEKIDLSDPELPDPFRAGEISSDHHLFYLNGIDRGSQ